MKTVQFVNNKESCLGEIPQSGLMYTVLNKDLVSLTPKMLCRDYILDLFWSENTGNDIGNIYGFTYEPGKLDLKDNVNIALTYAPNRDFRFNEISELPEFKEEDLEKLKSVLNLAESSLNFSKTELEFANDKKVILLTCSPEWFTKPYVISIYTLLWNLSSHYNDESSIEKFLRNITALNNNRAIFVKSNLCFLEDFFSGVQHEQKWESYNRDINSAYSIHNKSGFVNFNRNIIKKSEVCAD